VAIATTFQISLFFGFRLPRSADANSYSSPVPMPENREKLLLRMAFGRFSQPRLGGNRHARLGTFATAGASKRQVSSKE
jgi:hypothetical protein